MDPLPRFAHDAWLAAIIDSSEDAIISKTTTGIITSWNGSARRLFGYEAEEAIGQPVLMLFPPDRLNEEDRILARINAGERVAHFETERLRKDGRRIPISVTISPIRSKTGDIVGASKIARDISKTRELQQRLEQLNLDLESRVSERTLALELANRELDAFTSAVSHDLRAPLRAVLGFTQALHEDFGPRLPGEALAFLQQIDAATHRMEALVNGLLDLSRQTRGVLQRSELHIDDLARVSWRTLERALGRQLPDLNVDCPHVMYGDDRMLQALLDNLLGNAVKYAGQNRQPKVHIWQEQDDRGQCWVVVQDHGVGFDPAAASRIFEPFTRLHPASDYPGLGLGLATVQRIVARHGGEIVASGKVGGGAEFRFHLGGTLR